VEFTVPESPAAVFDRLSSVSRPVSGGARIGRAVVLGGSVAGLLAARVLADHAKDVVIIERDAVQVGDPDSRPGVPQSLQVHVLLPGGRAQLERWFPGLVRDAVNAGAVMCGPDECGTWVDDVRNIPTENSVLVNSSRPFLEQVIRDRTLALGNVRQLTGQATGLEYADQAVSAVRFLTDAGEQVVSADFVVDAMGRASRLSDWLEKDDWQRPELERMQIDLNYATGFFSREHGEQDGPEVVAAIARYGPLVPDKTLGALNAVEGGRWMVMLAGFGEDRPGRTLEDFLTRCAVMPPPFRVAVKGELIGEVRTYHQADARRRHFDRLERLPAGLVSVGDAVASFNPIYGQGMSSATLHASCLSEYLAGNPDLGAAASTFFDLQRVVVDAAWDLSASADLARLETAPPPVKVRIQRWMINQIFTAASIDKEIGTKFNDVVFMSAHLSTLATPALLWRAIRVNRRARRAVA
jgi:2-polyprenyl-6-methoxyphenol hydroxylase-like FAD-dependent oxidoreductase